MSRIVEECGCGARVDFEQRMRQTRQEQHEADQDFLTRFRAEHVCPLRMAER